MSTLPGTGAPSRTGGRRIPRPRGPHPGRPPEPPPAPPPSPPERPATAAGAAPSPARSLDAKWLVAASVSLGAMMATIDISIVNVALPAIRGSIGATIDQMTSLATSFAIAQAIVMPLTAFLGRIVGQKRVYVTCLGLFVAGSVLCGSPTPWASS